MNTNSPPTRRLFTTIRTAPLFFPKGPIVESVFVLTELSGLYRQRSAAQLPRVGLVSAVDGFGRQGYGNGNPCPRLCTQTRTTTWTAEELSTVAVAPVAMLMRHERVEADTNSPSPR